MRARHFVTAFAATVLWLSTEQSSADEPVAQPTASQQLAWDTLLSMATFLAGQQSFRAELLTGFDVVQTDGQKIQFLEAREILLARPDRLRAEERRADGTGNLVLFDGRRITVWHEDSNAYAQADQPGSVDDTVVYFERDLGMRLPLAALLTTRFPAELRRNVVAIDYVEETDVLGRRSHHIAGRTAHLDFQAWIAAEEDPLPLRIVLTWPDDGRPQYWAQFDHWDFEPAFGAANFAFEPPESARRIPFRVQVPVLADGTSAVEEAR